MPRLGDVQAGNENQTLDVQATGHHTNAFAAPFGGASLAGSANYSISVSTALIAASNGEIKRIEITSQNGTHKAQVDMRKPAGWRVLQDRPQCLST